MTLESSNDDQNLLSPPDIDPYDARLARILFSVLLTARTGDYLAVTE